MAVAYFSIVTLICLFLIIYTLTNFNLILKGTSISNFLKSPMLKYIINRIILSFLILFTVATCIFLIIKALPEISSNSFNDLTYYDYNLTNNYKRILPYPKNVCVSTNLVDGNIVCTRYEKKIIDFGYSQVYMKNIRVWEIIKQKCSVSFSIGITIYIIECLINYPLGIYLARRSKSHLNKLITILYTLITSIPMSLIYYLLLLVFMLVFKLPISFDTNNILTYIAPIASVIFTSLSIVSHWVKMYMQTEMNKDYVKYAYSKGLDEKTVFRKHIMKNALIPLVRTIPTSLVLCVSGYYILEVTFSIPGSGSTLISAIKLNDIYLIEGLVLFFSFLSVFSYLLGDIISVLMDPRIKYMEEHKNER